MLSDIQYHIHLAWGKNKYWELDCPGGIYAMSLEVLLIPTT